MPALPSTIRAEGLRPVVDDRTQVLILGSLPGTASLAASRYYAHPRNAFWRLIDVVLGEGVAALDYPNRLARLQARGVGLWDVIVSAEREGSLDQRIRNPEIADLPRFVAALPRLRMIGFNGATAARLGRKALHGVEGPILLDLPSSSPAHAALGFDDKASVWASLKTALPDQDS